MKTRIYLLLILLFMAGRVTSQLYPVEVFLNTPMNFPANLHSLSSGFGGLNLTMILRDATTVNTEVRLRFYLEKNGVRLVTGNDLVFGPISLISNTPVVLTGADLQTYFLPQSFQITEGINREEFLRSGGDLPEGLYTICVEVLDFRRFMEAPLSDRICSLTSMDLLDPPLITTPYDDQVVWVGDTLNQQPVDINWLMNYSTMIFPVDQSSRPQIHTTDQRKLGRILEPVRNTQSIRLRFPPGGQGGKDQQHGQVISPFMEEPDVLLTTVQLNN